MLVLFYYLSQNPDFAQSVQPLMGELKNSEQMLNFLKDLSHFSQTFSSLDFTNKQTKKEPSEKKGKNDDKEKTPQSPTSGIADEFIQNILDSYLSKNAKT